LQAQRCEIKERVPGEGFNKEQEKQLKRRKKSTQLTEVEKWAAIYLILYPDTLPNDMPSPCKLLEPQLKPKILTAIQDYYNGRQSDSELLLALRSRLLSDWQAATAPLESQFRSKLNEVMRECKNARQEAYDSEFQQSDQNATKHQSPTGGIDENGHIAIPSEPFDDSNIPHSPVKPIDGPDFLGFRSDLQDLVNIHQLSPTTSYPNHQSYDVQPLSFYGAERASLAEAHPEQIHSHQKSGSKLPESEVGTNWQTLDQVGWDTPRKSANSCYQPRYHVEIQGSARGPITYGEPSAYSMTQHLPQDMSKQSTIQESTHQISDQSRSEYCYGEDNFMFQPTNYIWQSSSPWRRPSRRT
jgi:hypothetical protein